MTPRKAALPRELSGVVPPKRGIGAGASSGARVLQYGRKRSGYLKQLTESALQHLHIHERSQPGESGSKSGQIGSELPRTVSC